MARPFLRRGALAATAACAALSASATPASAIAAPAVEYDETTTTSITSPADPFFTYYNDDKSSDDAANMLTLRGTADGNEDLVVRCYFGRSGGGRDSEWIADVDTSDMTRVADDSYTWEIEVSKDEFEINDDRAQTCRLHAIDDDDDSGEVDLAPYAGPRVGVGYWNTWSDIDERGKAPAKRNARGADTRGAIWYGSADQSFWGTFPQLKGTMSFDSTSYGGVDDAMPLTPSTFAPMGRPGWDWGAALFNVDLFGTAGQILVDGVGVYDGTNAPLYVDEIINRGFGIQGQPEFTAEIESFDSSTGALVIREESDLVRCDTPEGVDFDWFDLTSENCPALTPIGVRHVRHIDYGHDGRVAKVTDEYKSTDGNPHNVDVQFDNSIVDRGRPSWKVPGASAYAEYGEYDEIQLPASGAGSFVTKDVGSSDDLHVILAECADWESYEYCREWYYECVDEMGTAFCNDWFLHFYDNWRRSGRDFRAADGSSDVATSSLTYGQKPDRALYADQYGFVLEYNRNVPAEGSTKLVHAFGSGQTQDEIEALAAQMERDFTPPAPAPEPEPAAQQPSQQAPPAPVFTRSSLAPVRLGTANARLKGRKLTLRVVCAPGRAQGGTLKIRTRQGKRFTLGTRTYQCPAGGSRNVTLTVTKGQLRKLRKLGRKVRLSVYVVARDQDGKPVSIGQIITLTTR